VELVHGQPLDELTETDDELIGAAILDDAADDLAVVEVFVVVLEVGVEQLIQNVTAAGRQAGPDMLPGVLGRDEAADVDEPQQRLTVPLFQRFLVGAALLELGQLLARIIDQSRQLGPSGTVSPSTMSTFSRMTPEAEFRICTNASFSPCRSLMKCSVPLGSLSSACVLMISLAAAACEG
jgi:hypothetical protein